MGNLVVVGARRTAIGRFLGALKELSAVELACAAGEAVLQPIDRAQVDQVILGNVLSAGQGMNVARQVGVRLGLPIATPAWTVNMMCASGLQAILLAAQAIRAGEARCVLCGGTESMSRAPYLLDRARTGYKLGDGVLVDSLLCDGLVDAFDQQHMGLSAEALARRYEISRSAQDEFAARSQQSCAAAQETGVFEREIVPVAGLTADEHPRPESTRERLGQLKPAFDPSGTVTAGNASGVNDGAALLVLAEEQFAIGQGWPILARLVAGTAVGCEPAWMGLGPAHAIRQLCERRTVRLEEFDTIEINEAFAVQVLACLHELSLSPDRVNRHGGAIALGHPIGMSGARLAVHLVQQIAAGSSRRGLAALCVGGGMGIAADFAAYDR